MTLRNLIVGGTFTALLLSTTLPAAAVNTDAWYQYNGQASTHNFSLNFPTDWQVQTLGDDIQGFLPKGSLAEELALEVQEFEEQTYDQIISYFRGENTSFLRSEDLIFKTPSEDLLAKKIYYLNKNNNSEFSKILIKRGQLIISFSRNSRQYNDTLTEIEKSLNFQDEWHQYIDLASKYTFIFPRSLKINHLSNGVEILNEKSESIFTVLKYSDSNIEDAIEAEENDSQVALSQEDNFFHVGSESKVIKMRDKESGQAFSRIFIQKGSDVFSLSNLNVIDNFPVASHYNQDILEMLNSFEFFEIELDEEYFPYIHFPDVRDNHQNVTAINSLVSDEVINGYPDGTFRPNGQINRAELTKMIVATQADPKTSKYSACFPDVKEEWFAPYICYAKEQGWVEGYADGNFNPENQINRVEAIKIVLEALAPEALLSAHSLDVEKPQDVDLEAWYANYISYALNQSLLDQQHILQADEGFSYFPGDNISRKEVAEMIYRSQNR
jgi:hypothetical protein